MVGTLTMNHMTITKIYTLENDEVLDVEKSGKAISSMGNDTAVKRVLRIGILPFYVVLTSGNLCNNAHLGEFNKLVGQATDVALIDILNTLHLEDIRPVTPPPPYFSFHLHLLSLCLHVVCSDRANGRPTSGFQKHPSLQIANGWA